MKNKEIDFDLLLNKNFTPDEIVEYFKSKEIKISYNWHEVYEEAHAKAFTIAKMTNLDLLKDTQDLLTKTINNGETLYTFQKNAEELFAQKGWIGFKEMENPNTGEKEKVELGTPRRIKKIFDCNMRSAYSVGRYRQQMEDVDFAPYFQYMCILDNRTRPEHQAMHGKIFRYDDEFWQTMYPPNGWNCRCFVRSLSEHEVQNRGLKVENTKGKLKSIPVQVGDEEKNVTGYTFTKNGKTYTMKADAGWSANQGLYSWNLDVQAWNKVKDLPTQLKDNFISEMARNPYNKEIIETMINNTVKNNLKSKGYENVVTWLSPKIFQSLKEFHFTSNTPIVVMQDSRIGHIFGDVKIEKQKITNSQLVKLYFYINNPDGVYLDTKNGELLYIKHLPKEEIIDNRDVIKIAVKVNKMKKGKPVNYIATASRVNKETITKNKIYKKIE